jgi:hypothetical protein
MAQAQRGGGGGGTADDVGRGVQGWKRELTEEERAARVFALPYAVAALSLIIILVITCMPSRKMLRED